MEELTTFSILPKAASPARCNFAVDMAPPGASQAGELAILPKKYSGLILRGAWRPNPKPNPVKERERTAWRLTRI